MEVLAGYSVSRETIEKLQDFEAILREEAAHQNLISESTLGQLWDRHIVDSAQLAKLGSRESTRWVDIGSGAGLPGIVLAMLLSPGTVTLVEPRRLRAQFLEEVVRRLKLKASVIPARIERVEGQFDVITARAVAPLNRLLGMAHHLSRPQTLWVLPKGRTAKSELADAGRNWHYEVRAEPSITDPDSQILLLSNVRAKSAR